MTQEQLNEANKLSREISDTENSLRELIKVTKRIELDNFTMYFSSISIDGIHCNVHTERLIEFIRKEQKILDESITLMKTELNNL